MSKLDDMPPDAQREFDELERRLEAYRAWFRSTLSLLDTGWVNAMLAIDEAAPADKLAVVRAVRDVLEPTFAAMGSLEGAPPVVPQRDNPAPSVAEAARLN